MWSSEYPSDQGQTSPANFHVHDLSTRHQSDRLLGCLFNIPQSPHRTSKDAVLAVVQIAESTEVPEISRRLVSALGAGWQFFFFFESAFLYRDRYLRQVVQDAVAGAPT